MLTQISAQDTLYDKSKILIAQELNLLKTDKRGLQSSAGIIIYVEKDMQTVTAYQNNEILWQANTIVACGKPVVGKAVIRYIKLQEKEISVTFGKHNFASIDIKNGKIICSGSD